jgi:hypothetical protein
MSARVLLGAAMLALLVALGGMALAWPRSGMDANTVTTVANPRAELGRGWWSDSFAPHVVTSVDPRRREPRPTTFGAAR